MSAPVDILEPGTLLGQGRYRIEKLIGSGGMGEVYEATQVAIGRKVAVKQLHPEYTRDEEVVARFQREAQMAGSIGHDNICEVTDLGVTEGGAPYLVMPLLTGSSLESLIEGPEELLVPRLSDIVCQTLSALDAAHAAQIVHRDLKPDNIFVTRLGDRDDFVKLLDFGISKVIDQDSVSNLTRTGTVLGTPYYMAPEQARGDKTLDHRVDIYAIGVIMYEVLTRQRPFEGDSYNQIMFRILTEQFHAPRSLNEAIPAGVEQVILTAMARDPIERFSSAAEMRDTLKRAAFGAGVSVKTPRITQARTAAAVPAAESGPFTPTQMHAAATPSPTTVTTDSGRVVTINVPARGTVLKVALAALAVLVVVALVIAYSVGRGEEEADEIVVPAAPPADLEREAKIETSESTESESIETTEPKVAFPEDTKEEAEKKREKPRRRAARTKSAVRTQTVIIRETAEEKPGKKAKDEKGEVKGRFGTTFLSDYED